MPSLPTTHFLALSLNTEAADRPNLYTRRKILYKKIDKKVAFAGCIAKRKSKSLPDFIKINYCGQAGKRVNYLYFTIFARLTELPEPEWKKG